MQHMKIKSSLFAVVAAMLLAVPFARAAEREIVLVDMERAFNEFYKAKLADAELKKRADEYSEEHKGKVETYKKLQEEIAALQEDVMNNALSEAARVGVPAPEATWRTAADYWLRSQNDDGSWSYLSNSGASTVTMTLAGIASLFPPTHHR